MAALSSNPGVHPNGATSGSLSDNFEVERIEVHCGAPSLVQTLSDRIARYDTRLATTDDAEQLSVLVHLSFHGSASNNWSRSASERFIVESSPDAFRPKLIRSAYAAVALAGGQPIGFILLSSPMKVDMLFVHPHWFRRGVGRRLWEDARRHVESHYDGTRTIELNSTAYALRFYRSLGFTSLSREFELNGTRATRMACWLPGRALGVELGQVDDEHSVTTRHTDRDALDGVANLSG